MKQKKKTKKTKKKQKKTKKNIGTINKEAHKFKTQLTKVYLIFKFTMYSGGKINKETCKSNFGHSIYFYESFLITKFNTKIKKRLSKPT